MPSGRIGQARLRAALTTIVATTTGLALAASNAPTALAEPAPSRSTQPREVTVTLSEATNLTAAQAPDGSVVVDLHGMLYRVPASGGAASRLTEPTDEVARPDVGPDGQIVFQSYRDGRFHIWASDPAGGNLTQLTTGGYDDREPRWSPDGRHVVFSSDREGSYDIWSVEVATGALTRWTSGTGQEFEPSWTPDGSRVVFVDGNQISSTGRDGTSQVLVPRPADATVTLHSPAVAPDGTRVAYVEQQGTRSDLKVGDRAVTSGEDVFMFTPEWIADDRLLYTADGGIRTRAVTGGTTSEIPFTADVQLRGGSYDKKDHDFDDRRHRKVTGVLTPQLSPNGKRIAFVALNDLWLMKIGRKPKRLTDDSYQEVDPVFSPDGKRLAYSSDRKGTEDIFVRTLKSGKERRVTALDSAEVAASWSPDGRSMAFQDQTGATYVLDLASGAVRELVSSLFGPGRPTWSADSSTVAFAAVRPYSQRFREGVSHILTVDVATGRQTYQAPGDRRDSLSTRGDDGPVWSPDGRSLAFVANSALQVMPVDSAGTPTGAVRQVNSEVADAPSWSGDSRRLLYLSQGRLRLANVGSGKARTVPVRLGYRPQVQQGRKVIHAGRFWDGAANKLRRNVDITVVGNRIRSITPHRRHVGGGRVVDASGLTVMPGLMDSHVHQAYESRFFGDRQGRVSLAWGITSTLSVGDQVYRAMEDRDSLRAGERVGPRFYATGEPIDGSRVYYNFMRPTYTDAQVARELTRARKLDYDFVKSYVRLQASRMRMVVDAAHRLGVPSSSHYLSPGALVGQDGTTHLAATQRLGYARTITATGNSYADVPALYGRGNRTVTTTLFTTDFLTKDEFAGDRRLRLLPPWKRSALLEDVGEHAADPQDPQCASAACKEVRTLERISKAGGQVLVGTDSPLDNVAIGVHANMQEMVGYGWTPYAALRAAIVTPARYLGVSDDVGTLRPGKVADLIAVRGNPLADIDAAARVSKTMVGGRLYTQRELVKPFTGSAKALTEAAQGPAPARQVTGRVDPAVAQRYWWHDPDVVAEQYAHSCDAYEALEHQGEWGGEASSSER
ncbi:amidohydrolase family protein [Nocardioides sp. LHG3406-4]|uniref:amidohydrolase family protein n=1 Tax=Nocardioides sp. LHG3406-4 TaxID=2804575 RepID=UPI003CE7B94F